MPLFLGFRNYMGRQSENFKVLLIRRIIGGLFRNFQQYQSLFIRALGADPLELGYLNSVGSAASGLASLPVGQNETVRQRLHEGDDRRLFFQGQTEVT